MFRYAVRMTVVTHTMHNDKDYTSQRDTLIPAFDRDDAQTMSNVCNANRRDMYVEQGIRYERWFEPVAITERHNGVKLERTVLTFEELSRLCEEWYTAPSAKVAAE